jgi:hypothetical protein
VVRRDTSTQSFGDGGGVVRCMWVELQPSALRLRHPPKSKADGRVLGTFHHHR